MRSIVGTVDEKISYIRDNISNLLVYQVIDSGQSSTDLPNIFYVDPCDNSLYSLTHIYRMTEEEWTDASIFRCRLSGSLYTYDHIILYNDEDGGTVIPLLLSRVYEIVSKRLCELTFD